MTDSWYKRWMSAYERASFYKSEKNKASYWDDVADSKSDGLSGTTHIEMLEDYLINNNYLDEESTILDVGCGLGDYAIRFAGKCSQMVAMDYSAGMIAECKKRCEEGKVSNITFLQEDIEKYDCDSIYEGVFACLNPATYSPKIFSKLLRMAGRFIVYFSMDTPIEDINEPIYQGTNSVRYPEEYLKERGINYTKLAYDHVLKQANGADIHIPFAYLVIDIGVS